MPAVVGESDAGGALVKSSPAFIEKAVYRVPQGIPPPIARLSISWARGNPLYVSIFRSHSDANSGEVDDVDVGRKVLELKLSGRDGEISDSQLRRIAYGSVSPFALLQSRRNAVSSLSRMLSGSMPYNVERLKYVMAYSKEISGIDSNPIRCRENKTINTSLVMHGKCLEQNKRHHPWDLNTLKGHGDSVTGLCFSSDGQSLATACSDGIVRIFKFDDVLGKSFKFLRISLPAGGHPTAVSFPNNASSEIVASQTLSCCSLYMYGEENHIQLLEGWSFHGTFLGFI